MKGVCWKVSLIKDKATGSSASLLYVLWVPFLENKHCMCNLCEKQKIVWTSGSHEALPKQQFQNIMVFFAVAYRNFKDYTHVFNFYFLLWVMCIILTAHCRTIQIYMWDSPNFA